MLACVLMQKRRYMRGKPLGKNSKCVGAKFERLVDEMRDQVTK